MKPSLPDNISALTPYTPGRPIEEVERELGIFGSIKVASNENALGPSPRALDALRAQMANFHRYPDGGAVELGRKLAARLGVDPGRIVFGNGSNEILELLARLFAGPGRNSVMSKDGFLVYRLATIAAGGEPIRVAARKHHHDLDAMADAINDRTGVVFLANPNNPTGTIFRRESWERFLARVPDNVVIALDEAYFEFVDDSDYPNGMNYLDDHPGLVVVRTFSKAFALAGLRIGYGVTSAYLADGMGRLRQPFNVSLAAQVAASAALDDGDHLAASLGLVREGRLRFDRRLSEIGLDYVPSHANFVLVEVGDGDAVTQALLEEGVIVRPMGAYGLASKIRITFGTEEEDRRCLDSLASVIDRIGSP